MTTTVGNRMPERLRTAAAKRKARARERQRARRRRLRLGLARFTVETPEAALIEALIVAGYLNEADALNPELVEEAVGAMLFEWAERYRVTA
jgi:hypothetical protein